MYLALKLVHVTAVVLFMGNIITGLFWHAHAARTRDAKLLFHAVDGIIRSDRWFTIPGVVAIVVTGVLNALHAHLPLLGTPWIRWAIVLFTVSGLIYGVFVVPLQVRLRELARAGMASSVFDIAGYRRVALLWEIWGAAALLLPFAAMALMVLKPA